MRILIADESELICQRIADMLRQDKNVECINYTHSVKMTFEYIILFKPDAIIMDVQMFKSDGLDFVKKILNSVPLIILLVNNYLSQYTKCYQKLGVKFLFDKSNEFDKIPVVLNNNKFKQVA